MTPEQIYAQNLLTEVRRILADLPESPPVLKIESSSLVDLVELSIGGNKTLVLQIWGRKS